ncbi:MAG: hydrogenase maturation protein [Leptothrix sp. (in: Bacteria)]|nr:hydrogenase maturation protein [Leptothrix sp. (in: b-proteobacteria)]
MRILFLTRSFNGLAQRLFLELRALGHEVAVEFDIADDVSTEAVALYRPELVIAPFLRRAIPESIWRHHVCLVVHPGIVGDRGPSALDWAISEGVAEWGVTVLQAEAELDAGPVWAAEVFAMRDATKSSLYRMEVTDAAVIAVLAAVRRYAETGLPLPASAGQQRSHWRPLMPQAQRRIDWQRDDTDTVLRKIRAADGQPGVLDQLSGIPCHLFDAHREDRPAWPCSPGTWFGRRHESLLRATVDGAVRIGHLRRADGQGHFKLPATLALAEQAALLPECGPADGAATHGSWHEIRSESDGDVAVLHFAFYNGAISTVQCERLRAALRHTLAQRPRVLVLFGGPDFWCNGIHLNVIEAAASPADESWRNIVAMDDLTLALIEATECLVIAAMQGNAGAGGVFMALAADLLWARPGVVLNPHYKNMGNLYGSEYWTYLLPRRPRSPCAAEVMGRRLPISAHQAQAMGLIDEVFGSSAAAFRAEALARARGWATAGGLQRRLHAKQQQRLRDEATKPLAAYRDEELAHMRRNFYGFDPSYHIARSNFVHRVPASWTPRHLAVHRDAPQAAAIHAVRQVDGDQA